MATRKITTVLAIEGEAGYRSALKNCNAELKTLRSELGLAEEKFRTNANTVEALQSKVNVLTELHAKQKEKVQELQKAVTASEEAFLKYSQQVDEAQANVDRCKNALQELEGASGDNSQRQAELNAELEKYSKELQTAEEYQAAAKSGLEKWGQTLNAAQTEEIKLNRELEKNKGYLEEAKASADGCAKSVDEYGKEVKDAGEESQRFGEKGKKAIETLAQALVAAGIGKAVKEVAELLWDCTEAAIDFESAMAGVKKTTDLSDEELSKMSGDIQELSTRIPATATEIAGVVEAAGQLGIAKENLLDFAEVMVNLGTATNLSSEEAASALAKFANVVKMQPENYQRLGSTIVDLGNNFATTEADIVSMATRLASTGEIVGLTEPQIMAIATALSSVGIEAEAGGSAVSKLLKQMETAVQTYGTAKETIDATGHSLRDLELMASNDSASFRALASDMGLTTTELKNYMSNVSQLEKYAEVSGMAAEEFTRAWGTDAVGALGKFISGLGKIDEAGGSSVAVLQEMGITEIRLSNAVQALASSNGILERALDTANNAWEDNNALAQEAATRYETTESKLQMASNAASNLKTAIGNQLLPVIGNLADAGTGAFQWAADFVERNPWIVGAITGLATALGTLAVGVGGLAAAPAIISALNTAMELLAANPVVLIVASVAGLAAAIGTLAANSKDAGPNLEELTQAARNMGDAISTAKDQYEETSTNLLATANVAEKYVERLKEMGDYTQLNNDQQEEYRSILLHLTELMPELADQIDIENGYIEGGTDGLEKQIEAWKELAKVQAYQEYLTTLYKAQADVILEAEKNQIRLNDAKKEAADYDNQIAIANQRKLEIQKEAQKVAYEINKNRGGIAEVSYSDVMTPEYLGEMANEYWELANRIQEWQTAQQNATDDAKVYAQAIEDGKDAVTEAQEAIDEGERALKNLTEATDENSGALEGNTGAREENTGAVEDNTGALEGNAEAAADGGAAMEELREKIALLEEQYLATADSARENIQRQIDYFGELDEESENAIQDIISHMQAQADAVEKYADNITLAMERGVDHGLIEKLSDGSEKSAEILSAIVSGTDDQIRELNAAFGRIGEGTTKFGNAVAELEREYNMQMQGITQEHLDMVNSLDQHDRAYRNGVHTMEGAVEGVRSMTEIYNATLRRLAEGGHETFEKVNMINSPSKLYKKSAEYTVEGAIEGVEGKMGDLNKTYEELAREALTAYDRAVPPRETWPGAAQNTGAEQMAYDMRMVLQELRQMTSQAADMGTAPAALPGNATFVLTLGNGMEIARWMLGDLIRAADDNGTPIKNNP